MKLVLIFLMFFTVIGIMTFSCNRNSCSISDDGSNIEMKFEDGHREGFNYGHWRSEIKSKDSEINLLKSTLPCKVDTFIIGKLFDTILLYYHQ